MSPESPCASHWWHPPVLLLSYIHPGEKWLYFHLKIHIKSAHRDVPPTPTTTWSTPPVSFGLPRLVAGSPWAAGLVGEAESGSRSQNPVSSLMGRLAPLPVASVHQLRPIMWRRHIWPGFYREQLSGHLKVILQENRRQSSDERLFRSPSFCHFKQEQFPAFGRNWFAAPEDDSILLTVPRQQRWRWIAVRGYNKERTLLIWFHFGLFIVAATSCDPMGGGGESGPFGWEATRWKS